MTHRRGKSGHEQREGAQRNEMPGEFWKRHGKAYDGE
jgi:hypothetical protein